MSRIQSVSNRLIQIASWDRNRSRQILLVMIACCIATIVGCGKEETRLPTYKVTGKVVKKGVGVPNATVIFHAKIPPKGFIKPRAISNAHGEFTLTTYVLGDGAPEGEYEITLEQWLNDNPQVGATNRLPKKLGSPSASGLKASVAATQNTLSPFEIR